MGLKVLRSWRRGHSAENSSTPVEGTGKLDKLQRRCSSFGSSCKHGLQKGGTQTKTLMQSAWKRMPGQKVPESASPNEEGSLSAETIELSPAESIPRSVSPRGPITNATREVASNCLPEVGILDSEFQVAVANAAAARGVGNTRKVLKKKNREGPKMARWFSDTVADYVSEDPMDAKRLDRVLRSGGAEAVLHALGNPPVRLDWKSLRGCRDDLSRGLETLTALCRNNPLAVRRIVRAGGIERIMKLASSHPWMAVKGSPLQKARNWRKRPSDFRSEEARIKFLEKLFALCITSVGADESCSRDWAVGGISEIALHTLLLPNKALQARESSMQISMDVLSRFATKGARSFSTRLGSVGAVEIALSKISSFPESISVRTSALRLVANSQESVPSNTVYAQLAPLVWYKVVDAVEKSLNELEESMKPEEAPTADVEFTRQARDEEVSSPPEFYGDIVAAEKEGTVEDGGAHGGLADEMAQSEDAAALGDAIATIYAEDIQEACEAKVALSAAEEFMESDNSAALGDEVGTLFAEDLQRAYEAKMEADLMESEDAAALGDAVGTLFAEDLQRAYEAKMATAALAELIDSEDTAALSDAVDTALVEDIVSESETASETTAEQRRIAASLLEGLRCLTASGNNLVQAAIAIKIAGGESVATRSLSLAGWDKPVGRAAAELKSILDNVPLE